MSEASEQPTADDAVPERVTRELSALRSILRKTRRDLRAPLFFEGFAWVLVTAGAVAITAQFAGLLAGAHGPMAVRGIAVVGGTALALGAVLALVGFYRTRPSIEQVARTLQRHAPQFRNDIVAALQFGVELEKGAAATAGWSKSLATAHIERTNRMLLGVVDEHGTLSGHVPQRSTTPALVALGACLALFIAPHLVDATRMRTLWLEAAFPAAQEADEKAENRPIVGEIDILYSFPPYSDLSPRFEPFTTGHIETLVGTEVTLKTYPLLRDARKIEMVVETADGSRVVPLSSNGTRLEATLLLTKAGTYHFRAVLPDGTTATDGIDRPIVLQPDQLPSVSITSHPEQLEVSPDEVLDVEFTIEDDFGVESVSRAWAFGSDDPTVRALDLPELTTKPRSLNASFAFDLSPLNLQPKDTVTLWIEATDNNSLTGPGIGKSTPIILRVTSPEDRHMKLIADEAAVLEQLLEVLADFLDNPAGERIPNSKGYYRQKVAPDLSLDTIATRFTALNNANTALTSVLAAMADVVERMKEDPLMTKRDVVLFEGLYEQLYKINRDGSETFNEQASDARAGTLLASEFQKVADLAARTEDALEKGLVRLESLLAQQRMDAVRATAEDIRELKERLKELLEKYRDTPDPELKKAILREIQRLRQRMAELMARMQSQLKQLPQEHINMEALEAQRLESDAAQMTDNLQKIEDMLEQGDIDGALKALDEMAANLDAMTEDMNESFQSAESEGMREMDKVLSELMDKANDLETRQRDLEQRTREIQEQLDEEQREQTKRMVREQTGELQRMAKEQRERLERLAERELAPHDLDAAEDAAQRVGELERMLESDDIEQALERARMSAEDIRAMEFSLDLARRYAEPDTARGKAVKQSAQELGDMNGSARKIIRKLEEIMDQARSQPQQSGSGQLQELAREQADVKQQAGALRQDVQGASERFPMLEQQLAPPLDSATSEMEGAQKSLEGRKPQQGLDHQRSALESLRQLKQSMKDALQKEKQGGQNGQGRPGRKEKVVIPEKDGRSHEQFRDDIMKGMKDERLESYESEIERYYKSLME